MAFGHLPFGAAWVHPLTFVAPFPGNPNKSR